MMILSSSLLPFLPSCEPKSLPLVLSLKDLVHTKTGRLAGKQEGKGV